MAANKRAQTLEVEPILDWGGARVERQKFAPSAVIFNQGDPCANVLYVEQGSVRLTVVSSAGKEAVIADVRPGHFFGEGCLSGQPLRMCTATVTARCTIVMLERHEVVRLLHERQQFADAFLGHMLKRNIRIEEDLIDQLFNSTEKRLARALLLLARYGEPEVSHSVLPRVSQQLLAEQVGTTRSRVNFFMNKFRKLGFIDYNGGLKVNNSLLTVVLHD